MANVDQGQLKPLGNLNRFTIYRLIGEGSAGAVYSAFDAHHQRDVALKIPRFTDLTSQIRADLLREILAVNFEHPNVVRVLDFDTQCRTPWLSMPLYPRGHLKPEMHRDPRVALELVRDLAQAMSDVHHRGVLHRDLKPHNILLDLKCRPIIADFGLAVLINQVGDRAGDPNRPAGTPAYMAPEQLGMTGEPVGPACDIWALGVILHLLLTGALPFPGPKVTDVLRQCSSGLQPNALQDTLPHQLGDQCFELLRQALACRPEQRFLGMSEFADRLEAVIVQEPRSESGSTPRPLVPKDSISFGFVPHRTVSDKRAESDQLMLDVGNGLGPGVIDHHQFYGRKDLSTASMVLARSELIDQSVCRGRQPETPFTLILHEWPDLDGVAAATLVSEYLSNRTFPENAEELARYVSEIDQGATHVRPENPFTLYAAYVRLSHRNEDRPIAENRQRWTELVQDGIKLVQHVLSESRTRGIPIEDVDAFAIEDLFNEEDRTDMLQDRERYLAKLRDPECMAETARVTLPGMYGGWMPVDALIVRDVQNIGDDQRVHYFKDWARTDRERSLVGKGFVATCVFMSENDKQKRRCILSVRPGAMVTLRGLGRVLEREESRARRALYGGLDDRETDPATGEFKEPRSGYENSDPWYDGRAHGQTIVDSPSGGTILDFETIKRVFLEYSDAEPAG